MSSKKDPAHLSASEAVQAVRSCAATVEQIVAAQLRRIEARDGAVRAWAHIDPDLALAQARALESDDRKLPLRGMTIGVKDIIDTFDMPAACGSPIYAGRRPDTDAVSVARLRAAGVVMLGKTVTAEFATYQPGATRNPHNPGHTPGGSSSGSAAAVGDFQVQTAFGTQTAGSVNRPASFCGTIGYKATYGRFSYEGAHRLSLSLDTLGFFSRSFDDLHLLGTVLCLAGRWRAMKAKDNPRIAYIRTPWWDQGSAEMQAALDEAAAKLKAAGADVVEVDLPAEYSALTSAQAMLMAYEASVNLATEAAAHWDQLSPRLRELITSGRTATTEEIQTAHALARECRARMDGLFAQFSGILTPCAPGVAPKGLDSTGDPIFNRIWTFLGLPCVSFPIASGEAGLPLAAQIITPMGSDEAAIALAEWAFPIVSDWAFPVPSDTSRRS